MAKEAKVLYVMRIDSDSRAEVPVGEREHIVFRSGYRRAVRYLR